MAKRFSIGIALVLSSALLAWLFCCITSISAPSAPNRLTFEEACNYPDTGLPTVLQPLPHVERIAARTGEDSHSEQVAFEDTIRPDEDLLQGLNSAAQVPVQEVPAEQAPAQQTPPVYQVPIQQAPPQQPAIAVPTARPSLAEDSAQQPLSTPAAPPPAATEPGSDRVPPSPYDPMAPPADDEDLLRAVQNPPAVPNATAPPDEPIEVLPNRAVPETGPGLSPPTVPGVDQTVQPPRPAQPPVAPFVPPQHVTALPPHGVGAAADPHAEVFADSLYPSAKKCRECHEQIYDEWAASSHAYASVSPMFQCFEQTITNLTRGTIGYFCIRCHAPVATALNYPRQANIFGSIASAQEGVTCIACHRVREQYGKANGERRIEPGDVYAPVYGSGYGEGLAEVLSKKNYYKVKPYPEPGPGQDIHRQVIHFEQLSDSSFCVSCHQVFVAPGIELEVVWEQYRASPACKAGITCQDCHMGSEPGMAVGYEYGPVAIVNDKPVSPHRKHSNHTFYGPGYSIAHPGIFPFHPDADDWTKAEWLLFDYRAGWGTDQFEDGIKDGLITAVFPKVWENSDDRYDAREIVDANLAKLRDKLNMRRRLMENSSRIEGPIFDSKAKVGKPLKFHYTVTNTASGHNMPSGSLGAQPQLWVNVALTGPNGQHVWESGYVDTNGDLADLHSLDVASGKVPADLQLVNYQTKFLITGVKGTDREMFLPINTDFDQLPFIRPSAFPVTVMNHPPFIRMEAHSITPLGSRNAVYKVPARLMQQPGKYRLSIRMRSRAEPIYFMRFCNATPEMERNMNQWMLNYHEHATEFWVE